MLALNWHSFSVESYVYLLAAVSGASMGIALFVAVVSEGIGYVVLLIPRRIKQLKDQGREEGRKDTNRKWMAWYWRQQAASRTGLPFDEAPPGDAEDVNEK